MTFIRIVLACGLGLVAAPSFAQGAAEGSCIVAGRLSDEARWAPRMAGVELMGQDGKARSPTTAQLINRSKSHALAVLGREVGDTPATGC